MYSKKPVNKITTEYNTTEKQQRNSSGFIQHEIVQHYMYSQLHVACSEIYWVIAKITDLLCCDCLHLIILVSVAYESPQKIAVTITLGLIANTYRGELQVLNLLLESEVSI